MRIYIDGKDGTGWSIDKDRQYLKASIKRLGLAVSANYYNADIVHNIWWNSLLSYKKYLIRYKKNILVTTSNFVDLDDDNYVLRDSFKNVDNVAKAWVVPSTKQLDIFDRHNIRGYYLPFSIDLKLFTPLKEVFSKKELLNKYNIPENLVRNRVIIGSFQRDSLGVNLLKPKWQKGPELLIELLKDLPRDKFILLLAGPRRHFLISQCKQLNIPYFYVGQESNDDDLMTNSIDIEKMPGLYALLDVYLVTSSSEGGPKAVLEATATKTLIMSTDVGLAKDFVDASLVFRNSLEFKKALSSYVENHDSLLVEFSHIEEKQFRNTIDKVGDKAIDSRLNKIYDEVLKDK